MGRHTLALAEIRRLEDAGLDLEQVVAEIKREDASGEVEFDGVEVHDTEED